ncbi:MAG: DUF1653 domain-containing protein [Pseudomonadota bacterium]
MLKALDTKVMAMVQAEVPTGSVWRHVKSGGRYMVIGYCWLEATAQPAVLYARDEPESEIWARDAAEFLDGRFERAEGR